MAGNAAEYQPSALVGWILRLPIINRLEVAQHPREFVRFMKFATVGAIGMMVDLTVLNVMHKVFELPLLIANTISFTTAVISNFAWNRLWTFPESRQRPLGSQLGKFALVNSVGLGINTLILWLALHLTQLIVPDPWDYNLAKVLAIGVVLFWNYFVNRAWTYQGIE